MALALRVEGVILEQEIETYGLLVVKLAHNYETGLLEIRQDVIINRVVEDLGLDDGAAKFKWNPDKAKTLIKDEEGVTMSGNFSQISIVGIMLYLSVHTSLEIAYTINFSERYMFGHGNSHKLVLKRVGHHLKATRENYLY